MVVDFALIDQTLLVVVNELDRIFNRNDMVAAVLVDVVYHGAKRGGLAATGGARHQHKTFCQVAKLEDVLREIQLLRGQNLAGDLTEDAAHALRSMNTLQRKRASVPNS